jgi:hypothetical protein
MTAPFGPEFSAPASPEALLAAPIPMPEQRQQQTQAEAELQDQQTAAALRSLMAARVESVQVTDNANTVYGRLAAHMAAQPDALRTQYYGGKLDLGQLVASGRDSHIDSANKNIANKHGTDAAADTIDGIIESGNVESLLALLGATQDTVHQRVATHETTHDRLRTTHNSHVRATAYNAAALVQHRIDNPPPQLSNPMPTRPADRTRRMRKQWAQTEQDNRVIKWDHANEVGVPATQLAQEQRANQSRAGAVENAVRDLEISQAMGEVIDSLTNDIRERRTDLVTRLDGITEQIDTSFEGHYLGEPMPADAAAHTAELLARLAAEINRMSPVDELSHEYAGRWTIEMARLQQRRAIANINGPDELPRITLDRGVEVMTTDGPVVLYDDGSSTRAGDIRRDARGNEWQAADHAPTLTEEGIDTEAIRAMSDDQLATEQSRTFEQWEDSREANAEVLAAVHARERAGRIEGQATSTAEHVVALKVEFHTTATALKDIEANRGDVIDNRTAERSQNITNPALLAQVRADVTTEVENEIKAMHARIKHLTPRIAAAEKQALHLRTNANQAHYTRLFLAVTRPNEAGAPEANVRMLARGQVVLKDGTFNGIRGNWIVFPDGTSQLFDESMRLTERYNANGTRIKPKSTP